MSLGTMRIVGTMLAKREGWVLEAAVAAAAEWCDALVLLLHDSPGIDGCTASRACAAHGCDLTVIQEVGRDWPEMEHRQRALDVARSLGATHVGIIDADEILTAPLRGAWIRELMDRLAPGEVLDVPMVAPWRSLGRYRTDPCVWTRSKITVGFRDAHGLSWDPAGDGYQHHARPPAGCTGRQVGRPGGSGGVMHLQWAEWRRVQAKHALYQVREALTWPGRRENADLRRMYTMATDEAGLALRAIPRAWWGPERSAITMGTEPWQEREARRMAARAEPGQLDGLELFGLI